MTTNRRRPVPTPYLAAMAALALAPSASTAQDRALAFRGATIETVAEAGRIDSGTIVLRDGTIEAVGPVDEVTIPDDARVIDAKGLTIMPGIVEPAYPYRGRGEGPSGGGGRTVVIGRRSVSIGDSGPSRAPTFTRVADGFYPYESDLPPLLRSGLTHLNLVPPEYGQAAVARITPDDPDRMLAEPDGRLFASVTNATPSLEVIRSGLSGVSRPEAGRGGGPGGGRPTQGDQDGERPAPGGDGRGPAGGGPQPPGGPPAGPPGPARDLWRDVSSGKAPLMASANNAASVLYLLEILADHDDVALVLSASGADLYRTLDRLKDKPGKPATVLLRPTIDFVPNTRDRVNVPRLVHEAGLELAFTQGSSRALLLTEQDTPLFAVGYLVQTGLPREVALKALTLAPARAIGLDDRLGSVENGKSASLLVFDGDPLDPYSRLVRVLIDGSTVYER